MTQRCWKGHLPFGQAQKVDEEKDCTSRVLTIKEASQPCKACDIDARLQALQRGGLEGFANFATGNLRTVN